MGQIEGWYFNFFNGNCNNKLYMRVWENEYGWITEIIKHNDNNNNNNSE